jgi:hypothetical protein
VPRRLVAIVCAAIALFGGPAVVAADGPNNGNLLVPVDHVMPGEQFRITGFDIDPGITLTLSLIAGARSAELGQIKVALDGTVESTAVVPADFPLGYAELHAASDGEGTWSTAVLIGPRAEGPRGVNTVADDPSRTIALIVAALGLVIFVGAGLLYLRSGRRGTPASG